jgi:hypothetical protein
VTSSAGTAYQVASKNVTSYSYNNDELLNIPGNTAVADDAALAVLNGGSDTDFFTVAAGKITVQQ